MARLLVKSGEYTLSIDTDGASSAYGSATYQGSTSFETSSIAFIASPELFPAAC